MDTAKSYKLYEIINDRIISLKQQIENAENSGDHKKLRVLIPLLKVNMELKDTLKRYLLLQ